MTLYPRLTLVALSLLTGVAMLVLRPSRAADGPANVKNAPIAATPAPASLPVSYKLTAWDALVPKGWDPMLRYRNNKLSLLSDRNPQAQAMLQDMRDAWDNAPTLYEMDGVAVKMPGYVVPLESGKDGLREFLLVPYFGACIHTPPPPANQIIHVTLKQAVKGFKTMDAVWVSGMLKTDRQPSPMGVSGYQMDGVLLEAYSSNSPRR